MNIVCFKKIWREKISFKTFIYKFENYMDIFTVISEAAISK